MKEIKYISHFSRNIFLYFIVYTTIFLLYGFRINLQAFLVGLFAYLLSYAPVYFFNDYTDWREDKQLQKNNLYLEIKNNKHFWLISVTFLLLGLLLILLISKIALYYLLVLYGFNLLYSYKPLRLRDKLLFREIAIFCIYIIKWYLLTSLLGVGKLPLIIILMASSTAALSVSLYKRYIARSKLSEFIFALIFLITWCVSLLTYENLRILLFPLFPALLYLSMKYKNKQIPIGLFQGLYFIYALVVYIIYQ